MIVNMAVLYNCQKCKLWLQKQEPWLLTMQIFFLIAILVIFIILIAQNTNLAAVDLGRHIKNGEMIINGDWSVLNTNFYSFTNQNYPFINHHWLSGIIFYLLQQIGGMSLVSLLFIITMLSSFLIFFYLAYRQADWEWSLLISIIVLPVIVSRAEVRPEAFSYLLFAIFYYLLWQAEQKENFAKILWLLPLLMLLWVNLHVFFFLGFLVILAFWLKKLVLLWQTKKSEYRQQLILLTKTGLLCGLVIFINPATWQGAFLPFNMMRSYGYQILENQSVWFLDRLNIYPPNLYFKIALVITLLSWLINTYYCIKKKTLPDITNLIIWLFVTIVSLYMVRNFPLFGLFSLFVTATNIRWFKWPYQNSKTGLLITLFIGIFILLILQGCNYDFWQAKKQNIGLGLQPNVNKAAEFFQEQHIAGPIFNNYDIGSYLIYHLIPQEKVFVDNRPEAYPVKFFTEEYVPMQDNEKVWQEQLKKYNFNCIFFNRNDLTPWAQKFLIARIQDVNWAPIFVDDYNIIFIRNVESNKNIIDQYRLPQEMFYIK